MFSPDWISLIVSPLLPHIAPEYNLPWPGLMTGPERRMAANRTKPWPYTELVRPHPAEAVQRAAYRPSCGFVFAWASWFSRSARAAQVIAAGDRRPDVHDACITREAVDAIPPAFAGARSGDHPAGGMALISLQPASARPRYGGEGTEKTKIGECLGDSACHLVGALGADRAPSGRSERDHPYTSAHLRTAALQMFRFARAPLPADS
jgi:hypothetical protein